MGTGEEGWVSFSLYNSGGLNATVRMVLSTGDPVLEIVEAETVLNVDVGSWSTVNALEAPRIRLTTPFAARRQELQVSLDIYANDTWVERREIPLVAVSVFTWSGQVQDTTGRGVADVYIGIANGYSVTTAEDGTFQVELPMGTYRAGLRPPKSSGLAGESLDIELADDIHSNIVLSSTIPLSGVIRDPQGKPLEGRIQALTMNTTGLENLLYFASTNQDGAYQLMVARGSYAIVVLPALNKGLASPILKEAHYGFQGDDLKGQAQGDCIKSSSLTIL